MRSVGPFQAALGGFYPSAGYAKPWTRSLPRVSRMLDKLSHLFWAEMS
jgi:hypothetical protein